MPNATAVRELIHSFLSNPVYHQAFLRAVTDDPRPEGKLRRMWFPELLSSEEGIDRVSKASAYYLYQWLQDNPRGFKNPNELLQLWWDIQHGKTSPFPGDPS